MSKHGTLWHYGSAASAATAAIVAAVVAAATVSATAGVAAAAATATVIAATAVSADEENEDDDPPIVVISEHEISPREIILIRVPKTLFCFRCRYVILYEIALLLVTADENGVTEESMSNKEFDDFFKDLDREEPLKANANIESEDPSGFFKDIPEEKNTKSGSDSFSETETDFFGEDDLFAPPPPTAEEELPRVAAIKKEPVRQKKKTSAPTISEKLTKASEAVQDKLASIKKESAEKEKPAPKSKKKKQNTLANWIITILWVSGVLAISVLIASFALSSINDLVGFSKENREAEIVIPEGASLGDIADILKDSGIIDEPFTFEVYAHVKKMENRLYPGTYTLNANLGYDQIFQTLRSKEYELETVVVTFYEGMKATEIAKKLEENGVCSYDEFMEVVDTAEFDYEFTSMMGTDPNIYHKWEGYLFPDSYEFYVDMKPRSVLAKFIDNFNNKITAGYYEQMQSMGMTLDEVVTMASVIQSEAATKEDMHLVSSAFHNRLTPGSGFAYLQSDVTYFYYQQEIEPYVSDDEAKDTAYHTSYDTYYKKGLPVGPICNPGLDAIDAVLNPAESNYYYFVTDVNGKFYYASTLEQHEINTAIAGNVKTNG